MNLTKRTWDFFMHPLRGQRCLCPKLLFPGGFTTCFYSLRYLLLRGGGGKHPGGKPRFLERLPQHRRTHS